MPTARFAARRAERLEGSILPTDPGIDAKVAFLGGVGAYSDQPNRVETVETHMSWIFLTERAAYKLKKPAHLPLLDLRSLEARRRNAEAEFRLNRRLARATYLGLVPLTIEADGRLALGDRGEVVDWLVEMVRLPAEHMLDRRLASRRWRASELVAAIDTLGTFYRRARPIELAPRDFFAAVREECRASTAAFAIDAEPALRDRAARVARRLIAFLGTRRALFMDRLLNGCIVEGHGDLRPEHICLRPVQIIDCLEFNQRLRCVDPIDEMAFLAMECDRLGAEAAERTIFGRYRLRTGDSPHPALVSFYKAFRALLRARLAIAHLHGHRADHRDKWRRQAVSYLTIAERQLPGIRPARRCRRNDTSSSNAPRRSYRVATVSGGGFFKV